MDDSLGIAPISRVFEFVDSCINESQLKTCEQLAVFYARLAKEKGVVNYETIREQINLRIEEKREELEYCEDFCNCLQ